MGGALAELVASFILLRFAKGSLKNAVSMLIMVNSMLELAAVLKILATMDWDDIKRSLSVMGGALTELVLVLLALQLAKGSAKSAASILIMANSMIALSLALKILATMSWGDVIKSLLTMAGALTIFYIAAVALAPLTKVLIAVSVAIGLFGISLIALGAGLTLIATGLGALKVQFIGSIDLILASLKGLIVGFVKMIPDIIRAAKDIILALCETIIETAPAITKAFLTLLLETIKQLDEYIPPIVSILFDFLLKVIDELTKRMPELIVGIIKLVEAIFKGFKEAINGLDPSVLSGFIENAKSLSIIFIILAGLSKLFPAALKGVVEFGILVAELGAVMTALGLLSKIPYVNDLISSGGSMLENIGTGIGKFVGGIIGGIGSGISNGFPDIGRNLSKFMDELEPFINKIKNVDSSVFEGIKNLSEGILLISASNFINGISNLMNLGSKTPLGDFSSQLKLLGDGLTDFVSSLSGIDEKNVQKIQPACEAIKMLAEANDAIPNEGGWLSNIVGDNTFEQWAPQLETLGQGLSSLVTSLGNFSEDNLNVIGLACEAVKKLADANEAIPNEGGWLSKIVGDNSLEAFGKQLPELGDGLSTFVSNLGEFSEESVNTIRYACDSLLAIANLAKIIDDNGGLKTSVFGNSDLTKFAGQLPALGEGLNGYIVALGDFGEEKLAVVSSACEAISVIASLGYIDLATLGSNLSDFGTSLVIFGMDINTFITSLSEVGLDMIEASIEKVQHLISMASTIASINISAVSTFSDSLVSIAQEGVNGFCQAFSGAEPVEQARQAVITLINAVIEGAKSKQIDIYNAFIDLMNKALEAMRSKLNEFITVTNELCEAIILETHNHMDPMYNAGADFTMGFVEGMRSKIGDAARVAAEMAKAALDAAKAAIDSNSPSKETMALGGFFGEGFMIGIKSYSNKVYNEAYNTGDMAKEGLSKAISKISSIIDGGIDTSPIIRPVLDLSNIEEGVSRLDGMFNDTPIGLTGNVNSISNNFKSRIQNGFNSELLDAINKLDLDIQNGKGNTMNIYTQELDSEKLDQIVAHVNRKLGIVFY